VKLRIPVSFRIKSNSSLVQSCEDLVLPQADLRYLRDIWGATLGSCEVGTSLRRQPRFLRCRRRFGIRRCRRTSNKWIHLRMRRAVRLPQVFLCRGNQHNTRRQGSHNYGKSGWSCRTSRNLSGIVIQDLAFVKLMRVAQACISRRPTIGSSSRVMVD
jgi:hypothetical protein